MLMVIVLLALFAGLGAWRVAVVLKRGEAERSTGTILLMLGPMLSAPGVLLAWMNDERVQVPIELAVTAGVLGAVCVLLGIVLLVIGKKKSGQDISAP